MGFLLMLGIWILKFNGVLQTVERIVSNISFSNLVYQLLTIYHIWNERNCRIFQQKGQDITTVEKLIMEEVRSCVVSWRRIPKTPGNIRICVEWGIPKMVFEPTLVHVMFHQVNCQLCHCSEYQHKMFRSNTKRLIIQKRRTIEWYVQPTFW